MSGLAIVAGCAHPGGLIRERRIELGWTQRELAESAGVSQSDLSKIENGRLNPRWLIIHRLSSALVMPGMVAKRSLENGGRNRSRPKKTGTRWRPKGPIAPVQAADA